MTVASDTVSASSKDTPEIAFLYTHTDPPEMVDFSRCRKMDFRFDAGYFQEECLRFLQVPPESWPEALEGLKTVFANLSGKEQHDLAPLWNGIIRHTRAA